MKVKSRSGPCESARLAQRLYSRQTEAKAVGVLLPLSVRPVFHFVEGLAAAAYSRLASSWPAWRLGDCRSRKEAPSRLAVRRLHCGQHLGLRQGQSLLEAPLRSLELISCHWHLYYQLLKHDSLGKPRRLLQAATQGLGPKATSLNTHRRKHPNSISTRNPLNPCEGCCCPQAAPVAARLFDSALEWDVGLKVGTGGVPAAVVLAVRAPEYYGCRKEAAWPGCEKTGCIFRQPQ